MQINRGRGDRKRGVGPGSLAPRFVTLQTRFLGISRYRIAGEKKKKISLTRMILETERFVDEKRRHGFTYIRKQIIRCREGRGGMDDAYERYIKKKKKKKKKN